MESVESNVRKIENGRFCGELLNIGLIRYGSTV